MTEQTKPETATQKFRRTYRQRHDYFPDLPGAQAIERMRQAHPRMSTRDVIDTLVCAGAKALLPKGGSSISGNADVIVTAVVTSPRVVLTGNVASVEPRKPA